MSERKKAIEDKNAVADVVAAARALSGAITSVRRSTGSLLAMDHIDKAEVDRDVVVAVGRPQVALDQLRESLAAAEQRMVEVRAHLAMANASYSFLVEVGEKGGGEVPDGNVR